MQTQKKSFYYLLIASTTILIFTNAVTYVLLLFKNEEWKTVLTEKSMYSSDAFVAAEALAEHMYYDGEKIQCNQIIRHYNRSGKFLGNDNLAELLQGDKVVMLLSTNSCSDCAKEEIGKLLEISKKIGSENVVMVADFVMHTQSSWTSLFDSEGYYEVDIEHLGLKGSPTRETPVVMLTQNGRVKTSFIVGQQTSDFADVFHNYLVEYFMGKK